MGKSKEERKSGEQEDPKGRRKKKSATEVDGQPALPLLIKLGRSLAKDSSRVVDELMERDEESLGTVTKPTFAKLRPLFAALVQCEVPKQDVDALFEALDTNNRGAPFCFI